MKTMNNNEGHKLMNEEFDFSKVPSWYTLCTNNSCPLKGECLRHLTAQNAPDDLEMAKCVMPKALRNGECQWFDKITIGTWAAGFSHLFDKVMKKDYTVMRKNLTSYLHGPRIYYEYKRGERALSPEEQQTIRDYVKSMGYDWEVEFDRYFEQYVFHHREVKEQ